MAREDFEGLLRRARDNTYTKKTIKRAWVKAGLVPIDLEVLLKKIKCSTSTILEWVSLEHLPATTCQLQQLAIQGQDLLNKKATPMRIRAVLKKLVDIAQVSAVKADLYAYEANMVKRQLERRSK